jgi:hypothetical protein
MQCSEWVWAVVDTPRSQLVKCRSQVSASSKVDMHTGQHIKVSWRNMQGVCSSMHAVERSNAACQMPANKGCFARTEGATSVCNVSKCVSNMLHVLTLVLRKFKVLSQWVPCQ